MAVPGEIVFIGAGHFPMLLMIALNQLALPLGVHLLLLKFEPDGVIVFIKRIEQRASQRPGPLYGKDAVIRIKQLIDALTVRNLRI